MKGPETIRGGAKFVGDAASKAAGKVGEAAVGVGAEALANSACLKNLKTLHLDANRIGFKGMQAFAFNLRKSLFKDRKVREAIGYAFDFEWSNKNLFYGQYKRTDSFFENSELASSGLPSPEEL